MADVVLEGQVKAVEKRSSGSATYSDDHFTATVRVERVRKGKAVNALQTILVHYWQAGRRPAGWAGPGGQYRVLRPGERVQLFLRRGEKGRWDLLNPNGWEPVKTRR